MSKRNEQTTNATVHDALHRIFDREYVESHIRPILRPSGDNGDCICYEKVGDMSLYLYVEMGNDGYAKITQPILDMCGMSANEAYASAFKNICPAIYRMEDVITGYFGRMGGQDTAVRPENLYEAKEATAGQGAILVVSNTDLFLGAATIFDKTVKARLCELFGGEYYIMPSSINETICCSSQLMELMGKEQAKQMVREINAEEVEPADRLSDEVYVCTESGEIRVA